MEFRVTIEGVDEAIAHLDRMVGDAALREGLAGAAHLVEGYAKVKAPFRYGHLRNSIHVSRVTAREATVTAGADYALYVEMGTRKMAARPYLRPAVEDHVAQLADVIRNAIQRRAR